MKKVIFAIMTLTFLWSIEIYSGNTDADQTSNTFNNVEKARNYFLAADSYLQTVEDILQRQRVLAIRACNGTYTYKDRKLMDNEFRELQKEIFWIKNSSTYKKTFIFAKNDNEFIYINTNKRQLKFNKPGLDLISMKRFLNNFHENEIITNPGNSNAIIGVIDEQIYNNCDERNRIRSIARRLQIINNQQMKINAIENKLF